MIKKVIIYFVNVSLFFGAHEEHKVHLILLKTSESPLYASFKVHYWLSLIDIKYLISIVID